MTTPVRSTVFLSLALTLITVVARAQITNLATEHIAYVFDCSGKFFRIDVRAGTQTQAGNVPGAQVGAGGYDGCLVEELALDPQRPAIYAVMSKQRRFGPLGLRQNKVVSLQLPDLSVLSSADLPVPSDNVPNFRYDAASHELSVSYPASPDSPVTSGDGLEYVLSTEDLKELDFKARFGAATPERVIWGPVLTSQAYFHSSGRIVDRDRIVDTNGSYFTVNPASLLTEPIRRRFQSLQRTGAKNNKYIDILFADSAAGRMLFLASWDINGNPSPAGGGLLVYDAINEKTISATLTPFRMAANELLPGTPTIHLSPNGQVVVVEEYRWESLDAGGGRSVQQRFKTGKLVLYDAASGSWLRTIDLSPAPGLSGRFVTFSPDSSLMYYASGQNLYVADLSGGQTITIQLPQGFSPVRIITAEH